MCLATIRVWTQTCRGTNMFELSHVVTVVCAQSCMGTNVVEQTNSMLISYVKRVCVCPGQLHKFQLEVSLVLVETRPACSAYRHCLCNLVPIKSPVLVTRQEVIITIFPRFYVPGTGGKFELLYGI